MFRAAFQSVDVGCDFLSTRQIDGDIRYLHAAVKHHTLISKPCRQGLSGDSC